MLGLVNRSIEVFLRKTYGEKLWQEVARRAEVDVRGFNSLRQYSDQLTSRMLKVAARKLGKSGLDILEDTGAWLVQLEPLRRLLRFSGSEFPEFVLALEELPGRARMALPQYPFPQICVSQPEPNFYRFTGPDWPFGLQWMVAGVLRGMADDYGVLAVIEASSDAVELRILMEEYSTARPFAFSRPQSDGERA